MFHKQVSLVKFLFPYLVFRQIVLVCSFARIPWLCFSCLKLILYWVQKMHRSGMKLICLMLSLNICKYVGLKVNLLLAFTERCLLARNVKACE